MARLPAATKDFTAEIAESAEFSRFLSDLRELCGKKSSLPHVVAVTAEPLPTRIASLALGTGDIDCVYHFALNELKEAIAATGNEDQIDMLDTLIGGRRLRDISDLPFDLAV